LASELAVTPFDAERATAGADVFRFLAACYYEPAPVFAEENLFESLSAAATHVHPDLAQHARRLGEHFSATPLANLLLDYTRLFLGPTNALAQPYASVWLTGEKTLMQDSTAAVVELYRQGGFELDESFRELPDHIAAELEFVYLLAYRQNAARQQNDSEELASIASLRKRFLDEHLRRSIGPFAEAMKAGAQSAFYGELATMTLRAVELAA